MIKLATYTSIAAIVTAFAIATLSPTAAEAGDDACKRTEFKTELVKNACAKGGQKVAKDAMKQFNKDKKIKSCNRCHTKLAPSYELKTDGLKQFQDLGGK